MGEEEEMRKVTKHTQEWKDMMSKRFSGSNNPMYGKKGKYCPFYGRKHSKETINKMSLIKLGKKMSQETKNKLSLIHQGIKPSLESRKKMSLSHKGFKHKEESKQKLREKRFSHLNPNWKNDNVSYDALHTWVLRHKPKTNFCECCQKVPPYDLANISGKYKRDINDFEWLCRSCHMKKDGRINNRHNGRFKKWDCLTDLDQVLKKG